MLHPHKYDITEAGVPNGEVHSPSAMGQNVPAKIYVGIHRIVAIENAYKLYQVVLVWETMQI